MHFLVCCPECSSVELEVSVDTDFSHDTFVCQSCGNNFPLEMISYVNAEFEY